MFNPNWIKGKTVARVEMHPFDTGRGHNAYNPVIFFTDGSSIRFVTEETDSLEYGTDIVYERGSS